MCSTAELSSPSFGFLLPLQMLLLPPRPPHPRSSSPEAMDPPPPKAPPFPKTEGPSSTPSSAAGPRPPRLGRHLLIDANGVPYTYTVQLEEEPRGPPQREAPPGEPGPRKGYSCPECCSTGYGAGRREGAGAGRAEGRGRESGYLSAGLGGAVLRARKGRCRELA
nr:zinc finger protein 580 [Vicugna pacos]